MTNQEAIKWIDSKMLALACHTEIARTDKEMDRLNKDGAALQLARTAIYKQIPEKPEIKECSQHAVRHGHSGIYKRTIYSCQRCGKPLYVQHHFEYESESSSGVERWPAGSRTQACPACGQALKWED